MDILSLPAEIICEISQNIELPEDIVRFSLACRDFYACRNIHLLTWVSRMRSVIGEINKIEYEICDMSRSGITGLEMSYRKRNGISTVNQLYKLSSIMMVNQSFQPEYITEYQKKHLGRAKLFKNNPNLKRTDVVFYHNAFNCSKSRTFTTFYDNLIL
jgi:hypothetical protein